MKYIIIDGRFVGENPTGIGIGLYGLIRKLKRENIKILVNKRDAIKDEKNLIPIFAPIFSIREQIVLPIVLERESAGCVYIHHFISFIFSCVPSINFIHDLIPFDFPRDYTLFARIYYYILNFFTIRIKSRKIFVNSYRTYRDILKIFPIPPKKIAIVGHDSLYKVENKDFTKKKKSYFLFVGNGKIHKNLNRVIDSFLKFKENIPRVSLVVVGKVDTKKEIDGIIYTGYVNNEKLRNLYKEAVALVFPSLKEGFGIPILDANALGTPVITSDRAPTNYVGGSACFKVNPESVDDIVEAMKKVYTNRAEVTKRVIFGFSNRKRFSFEKMAKKIGDALKKCL